MKNILIIEQNNNYTANSKIQLQERLNELNTKYGILSLIIPEGYTFIGSFELDKQASTMLLREGDTAYG